MIKKKILGRSVVILCMIAAVLLSSWFIVKAVRSYIDLSTTKVDNSPYSSKYQAKSYPAEQFLNTMVTTVPKGIAQNDWNTIKDSDNVDIIPDSCTVVPTSNALLMSKGASGKSYKVGVQVYGAGQARIQYEKYAASLQKCYSNATASAQSIEYPDGYLVTFGDTIISVLTKDDNLKSVLIPWFSGSVVTDALKNTQCLSTAETVDDAKRSFYYDGNSYTGLIKNETVSESVTFIEPSSPQYAEDNSYDASKIFKDPTIQTVSAPLSPLPSGMSATLPSAPSLPSFSAQPSKPAVSKVISYQAADLSGPGCGWSWSGQTVPKFNTKLLDSNRSTLIKNAKQEISNNANAYNQQIVDWSQSVTYAMDFSTQWDAYTNSTNTVYASWKTLNDARNSLKPQWDAYIALWKTWSTWDSKRSEAANQYAKDLQTCVTDATSDSTSTPSDSPSASSSPSASDSASPSATATPSPSTSSDDAATIQKNCEGKVAKPDILTQTKPSKPSRPTIPDGVTIPDSWEKDS